MTDPYAGKKLDCDIVMKGGITSGVVYPGAIARLAEEYRFRAIGGTSAGAIAAAILAAAEYRRQKKKPSDERPTDGFHQVQDLPTLLGEKHGGERLLMSLFQADKPTKGLFKVLKGFLKHGKLGGVPLIWFSLPLFPVLGVALMALCIVLRRDGDIGTTIAWIGGIAGLLLMVLGPFVQMGSTIVRLPDNFFGLCTLGKKDALTPWLHEQIQTAAGLPVNGRVLTFADLWGIDESVTDIGQRMEEMLVPSADPRQRIIDLQIMTTDLTHGRPRRLPAGCHRKHDDNENSDIVFDDNGGRLMFDPEVLRRFFPRTVVEHMERSCKPIKDKNDTKAEKQRKANVPDHYRRFPLGPDMPVVVAARMSLSFPVLIAALPLWDIDDEKPDKPLKRVVFSDGGITSNFPVHFFDTPLPRRPTFGLNLTTLPREIPIPKGVDNQASAVREPPRASGQAPQDAREIEKLTQFFASIKDAMQNWRDNLQAAQPGFRDRIVPVMLGKGEGGMALNMSDRKILELSARGRIAGGHLVQRFAIDSADAGPGTPWNEHRLGRYRITMAAAEEFMKDFKRAYVTSPEAPDIGTRTQSITMSYADRVALATDAPYRMSLGQRQRAPEVAERYCDTLPDPDPTPAGADDAPSGSIATVSLVIGAPRPRSILRAVPRT
jgi:predicted acylesterase/phospholipase RssA